MIKAIKLQMVLQMEPQMSSTHNGYQGPLDQPTGPLMGLESSPLEDTTTAGPLLCPYPAGSSQSGHHPIPNSRWSVLLRGGFDR
nr:syncytin-1-like [Pongo abelii]